MTDLNELMKQAKQMQEQFQKAQDKLSDIVVYDIFSPPVASRIYAYPTIAAYEVLVNDFIEYKSFAGQLNELNETPKPNNNLEYSFLENHLDNQVLLIPNLKPFGLTF